MADVYLYSGEANPSDVRLQSVPSGGTADFVDIGAGGVILAGTFGQSFSLSFTASGAITLAGSAEQSFGLATDGAGGVALAGAAGQAFGLEASGSGGVVFAGGSTGTVELATSAGGVVTFAGSGTQAAGFAVAGGGGIEFAGSASQSFEVPAGASGGAMFAGEAVQEFGLSAVGSGGVEFGGAATQSETGTYTPAISNAGGGGSYYSWPLRVADPVRPVAHFVNRGRVRASVISGRARTTSIVKFANRGRAQAWLSGAAGVSTAHRFSVQGSASALIGHRSKSIAAYAFQEIQPGELNLRFRGSAATEFVKSRRHIDEEEFLALAA